MIEGITELLFTSDNYLGLEKELPSIPNGMLHFMPCL